MARAQFQRTTSTVPAEIEDASVRRREARRHRQSCREALAVTSSTDSLLALAWTTWVAVRPNMFVDWYRQMQHHNGPNYAVDYKKHGRDGTTH